MEHLDLTLGCTGWRSAMRLLCYSLIAVVTVLGIGADILLFQF